MPVKGAPVETQDDAHSEMVYHSENYFCDSLLQDYELYHAR